MILPLTHHIHFYAKHIQEVANIAADLLSHLHVSECLANITS